jgi:hypothetical protein
MDIKKVKQAKHEVLYMKNHMENKNNPDKIKNLSNHRKSEDNNKCCGLCISLKLFGCSFSRNNVEKTKMNEVCDDFCPTGSMRYGGA